MYDMFNTIGHISGRRQSALSPAHGSPEK